MKKIQKTGQLFFKLRLKHRPYPPPKNNTARNNAPGCGNIHEMRIFSSNPCV